MKTGFLPLIIGCLLGAVTVYLVQNAASKNKAIEAESLSQSAASDSNSSETAKLKETQEALEGARNRIRNIEQQNMDLAMQVQDLLKKVAEPAPQPAPVASTPTNTPQGLMGGRQMDAMKSMVKNQMDGQLARLNDVLNLTPEQLEQAREIYSKAAESAMVMAERMLNPDGASQSESENVPPTNPDAALREILDADQLVALDEFQEEEATNNARLIANSELLQMNQMLGLSQDQQDSLFGILYEQSTSMARDLSGVTPTSQLDAIQGKMQQKIEAVRASGILSDEQMRRFEEQQRQQLELIESMLPKPSGGGE